MFRHYDTDFFLNSVNFICIFLFWVGSAALSYLNQFYTLSCRTSLSVNVIRQLKKELNS